MHYAMIPCKISPTLDFQIGRERTVRILPGMIVVLAGLSISAAWGEGRGIEQTMIAYERLIGDWEAKDNSRHSFKWGPGHMSILSSTYFKGEEGDKLVSQGQMFYHPGRQAIVNHVTAIDMGIDLFEITSSWEGETLVNKMTAYPSDGAPQHYTEKWDFSEPGQYAWTLWRKTEEGLKKEKGGVYYRAGHMPDEEAKGEGQ